MIDTLAASLQPWQNFYFLTGTAAATLTGLMFISLTFGATLVTKETAATTRAFFDPTYMHFVQVLLTAVLLMIPILRSNVLGVVMIVGSVFRLGGLGSVFLRYREVHRRSDDIETSDWISSIVLPLLCHLLLLASGIGFMLRNALALSGLAIVTFGLLAIGIYGAWEVLVWMVFAVGRKRDGDHGEGDEIAASKTSST